MRDKGERYTRKKTNWGQQNVDIEGSASIYYMIALSPMNSPLLYRLTYCTSF